MSFDKKYRIILISTAVVLSIMVVISIYLKKDDVIPVDAVYAQEENVYNSIIANGQVGFEKETSVYQGISGVVTEVYVKSGAVVSEGDQLLKIRSIDNPKIDVSEERVGKLLESLSNGEITDEQQVLQVFATSDEQTEQLGEEVIIKSNTNGIVLSINSVGDTLYSAMPCCKIADENTLSVYARIPEAYISQIEEGQQVNITGDAFKDTTYSGTVREISATASKTFNVSGDSSTYVKVGIDILNQATELKSGYNVKVKIFTDRNPNSIIVPYEAILQDGEQEYVYVMQDGVAVKRYVKTGYELTESIQIKEGLSEGEIVIINAKSDLQEGDKVEQT